MTCKLDIIVSRKRLELRDVRDIVEVIPLQPNTRVLSEGLKMQLQQPQQEQQQQQQQGVNNQARVQVVSSHINSVHNNRVQKYFHKVFLSFL